jgi:uncharacterized protein YjiK
LTSKINYCLIVIVFQFACVGCNPKMIRYDLNEPDQRFKLSNRVDEISGLTTFNDSTLICVDDELGKFFFIDFNNGNIIADIKFGKKGDFEGVEIVDSVIYVLKSNGTINMVIGDKQEIDTLVLYETGLEKLNTEGLGTSEQGELLIACKGRKKKASERQIFTYDPNKEKLKLLTRITYKKVKRYVKRNKAEKRLKHLIIDKEKKIRFSPSGIASHPTTGNLYVISANDRYLMVLSPNGRILFIQELDKKRIKQPEGICFSSDGSLIISNEARNKKATLLLFKAIDE